jgi:peptidoglycan glycosyltransferase
VTLNRRAWHLAHAGLLLLALLLGRLAYWQLIRGQPLQPVVLDPVLAAQQYTGVDVDTGAPLPLEELPQPVIQRTVAALAGIRRGAIYDRAGRLLAADQPAENGGTVRVYPLPALAPVVGYVSGLRTGVAGVEHSLNRSLLGLDRLDSHLGQLIHQPVAGSDVTLSVDADIQNAAVLALGDRAGAVVVLDARSGAVLALASSPSYDPNRMLEPGYAASLLADRAPLLNRATQGRYTPGSTWKTVTLIAALDTGQAQRDTLFDMGPPIQGPNGPYYVYRVGGGEIEDHNHAEQVLDLDQSFARSANAAFARLGDELGGEVFLDYAQRLGFSSPRGAPPIELAASAAQAANDPEALLTNPLLRAATAIGQGELLTSPLNMALVISAVLNDGDVPAPYLVHSVRAPGDPSLSRSLTLPRGLLGGGDWLRNTMRPATARAVREMLIYNVAEGGLARAAVPEAVVGGKTGTAQLGGDPAPHAWFVGFAERERQSVVVAVVVEHGGSGSQVAAPIFSQVAAAALRVLGEGDG